MKSILTSITVSTLLIGYALSAQGQEFPPLLLDDDKPAIKLKSTEDRNKDEGLDREDLKEVDPEKEIIAIVNTRILTRAELNSRVSSRYEIVLDRIQSQSGGVVANFGPNAELDISALSQRELLEEQKEELKTAMRQEEREAVKYWVDFALLSEEARRQGLIVSQAEFRQRMTEIEQSNKIEQEFLNNVLSGMQMSHADYERYIYDALMVDKMLKIFVDLNYDEDHMREAYDSRPEMFYEPQKWKLAHFTVTVGEEVDRKDEANRMAIARKVRSQLRRGEDPETLFSQPEFNRTAEGIAGSVPGWYTFKDNTLPKIVAWHGQRLKLGDVSDVIENKARGEGGKIYTRSLHVLKVVDYKEATGQTFESALPTIRSRMLEVAQMQILEQLQKAGTHKVITSLSGIRPDRLPSREDIIRQEATAEPISLKLPSS